MKKNIYLNFSRCIFGVLFFTLFWAPYVFGADLSSPSFIVRDPVVGTGGGFFSSGSFQMFGSGDGVLTGYNTSLSFIGEFGFLYFPAGSVTPPIVPPAGGGGGGVATIPVIPIVGVCARIADFNCDGAVDILDLSILLYYTDKSGDIIKPVDLSGDGVVDLRDISIVFYHWDL